MENVELSNGALPLKFLSNEALNVLACRVCVCVCVFEQYLKKSTICICKRM